jgi:uncharacterized protein YdiU (UPF0061 family)
MDYRKIYENLCKTRQIQRGSEKKTGYELHHIHPASLGGSDDKSNLVLLTYREHYLAHLLLTKIYSNEPKMHYAFLCMIRDPHENRRLTSRMIETIKNNFSQFKSWYSKTNNPMFSDEAKRKLSEHMKNNNPMTKFPEKNHTVKKTTVYYENGEIKEFRMKKEFMETLVGLTHTQRRYKIQNNDLREFGIVKIEMKNTTNIASDSCIGRKWYTNGVINEFVTPGKESSGFQLGVTRK